MNERQEKIVRAVIVGALTWDSRRNHPCIVPAMADKMMEEIAAALGGE